jgi:predicted HTH transcriptional regulator
LVKELCALPAETSWVEFKHNIADGNVIGARISALSNSARLADKHTTYMIWGVEDETHRIVGTTFNPSVEKAKNQPLEMWLSQHLSPKIFFQFKELIVDEKRIVVLEIPAATTTPVEFDRTAYIRVGSATPRLSDHTERLKSLWTKLQPFAWETAAAKEYVQGDEVLKLLDYPAYFRLLDRPLPDNRDGIFEQLNSDKLIEPDVGGRWNITNLGAILFGLQLEQFERLSRKAMRIMMYGGTSRADAVVNRRDGQRGYASGFEGILTFINGLLPRNEHIGQALRAETPVYPEIALRELVANALIHQDMTINRTGPMVEIFSDRIEITNPGRPLIDPQRFIDMPPRSRNEALASLMRRMRICEEQGSGVDKVVTAVEVFQLPAPDFRVDGENTKAVLLAPRSFADMTAPERVRACYQHAVLKFLSGGKLTNSSLRARLGIAEQNAAQVTRIINEARDSGLIKLADPDSPRAGYLPFWA